MIKKLIGCLVILWMMAPAHADIVSDAVSYSTGEETLIGYLAYDDAFEGPRPGVLVVHEWWGQNDYVRMRADMLAKEGYVAFALDMYGDGKTTEDPEQAGEWSKDIYQNMDVAKERFTTALMLLREHPLVKNDDLAAIGYCFGGGIVLRMARRGVELDGVASFHGSLNDEIAMPKDTDVDILVLHGAADPMVPKEHVSAFKAEMTAAGVDYEVETYEGATHAFTNPAATEVGQKYDLPVAYDEKADQQSWKELMAFFDDLFADE